ncbi:MAG: ribosome maturation factor RimP [Syntrophobacteraceae bacterium]
MPGFDEKTAQLIAQIQGLVEPVILSEGMDLVDIEYRREAHGWVLRFFIDREGGVTVDDCARISHVAGDLLDVTDLIPIPYHLEISSPGLDRPLRKFEHFQQYIGKIIDVRTVSPICNRRKFKGALVNVGPERIIVHCDDQPHEIPLSLIERARLCYFESFGE